MKSKSLLEILVGRSSDKVSNEELENLARPGRYIDSTGYVLILKPYHLRADSKGYVREHILTSEKKLGRSLNQDETPHHIDGNKSNNHPDNLSLFESRGDHKSHHEGLKAFKACGHSDWRQCCYCHEWDSPENLVIYKKSARHKACAKKHNEKRCPNRRPPRKEAALQACGHESWRKCRYCKEYDDPKNMYVSPDKAYAYHPKCHAEYRRGYKSEDYKPINPRITVELNDF